MGKVDGRKLAIYKNRGTERRFSDWFFRTRDRMLNAISVRINLMRVLMMFP